MIYRCGDRTCNFWGEGAEKPERCPRCGRKLLIVDEAEMSGDDWAALGASWMDAEMASVTFSGVFQYPSV